LSTLKSHKNEVSHNWATRTVVHPLAHTRVPKPRDPHGPCGLGVWSCATLWWEKCSFCCRNTTFDSIFRSNSHQTWT